MKKEGDRKICEECKSQGINIEIVCKRIIFKGEERLSFRNPDGSAHFNPIEQPDGSIVFEHTPTIKTPLEVWQDEVEERISKIERQLGRVWGE